jgi:hypothetical protein
MVELYSSLLVLCFQALISNPHTVRNLPEHQQMYIIEGTLQACSKELEMQKMLACAESPDFCLEKEEK